jgi:hypothetical protein
MDFIYLVALAAFVALAAACAKGCARLSGGRS